MTLCELEKNKNYIISQIDEEDEQILKRYFQLGLFPGAEISLKRKAPLFKDPIIFQIEHSQIVLTKAEAKKVFVHTN